MANLRISDMTAASSLNNTDLAPIVQSGTNKKSTLLLLRNYAQATFDGLYVPLARTITINGDTKNLGADRTWTIAVGVDNFLDLTDTPNSYSGQTLKAVRVNAGETALEFYVPASVISTFLGLTDTPDSYSGQSLKAVRVNSGETALEFYVPTSVITTFLGLTDTPDSFSGQSLKAVRVNTGETALEFYTPSAGVTTFLALTDTPDSFSGQANKVVSVKSDESALEFTTPSGVSGSKAVIGFSIGRSGGLTTGKVKGFFVCPYAATISAFNFVIDTGTATVKVWKIATGTAKPTSSNSINTSGVSISTGTALRSTSLSDFTSTTVTANDIFAFEVTALTGSPTELTFELELTKT